MNEDKHLVLAEQIERRIFVIRGHKVLLNTDLAELYAVEPRILDSAGTYATELYSVETRFLNQAVKRNVSRFPEDFMFQLNRAEAEQLVSQNVIPHKKYFGGSLPYMV